MRALRLLIAIWLSTAYLQELPAAALEGASASAASSEPDETTGLVGDSACRSCHPEKFSAYMATAHHLTSRLPDRASIAGSFINGKNVMKTFNPELSFVMESRDGMFFETAIERRNGRTTQHTERIDVVIGSATKGQTYLYWKQNALFELPVSYWRQLHQWVNSPGYVDGSADFDRPVLPRCLECHSTYFEPLTSSPAENRYKQENIVLGISCERCHGPGMEHIATHSTTTQASGNKEAMPPMGLKRDRQIDVCAQCHGGAGQPIAPAFSFRPGRKLSEYVRLQPPYATDRLDVHGNQVALLERSRCFQASAQMSCSTCHDVHRPERPAPEYSARCMDCHRVNQCGMFATAGNTITSKCIDCHMPLQASNALVLDAEDKRLQANVRTHWIRIY